MAHYSVTVVGSNLEEQLSIFDQNLQVERYKVNLDKEEVAMMAEEYGLDVDDYGGLAEAMEDWVGFAGGIDWKTNELFYWSTLNPRAKWNWYMVGGRWIGSLKTFTPYAGDLGKPGSGLKEAPLRYGPFSADQALFGDIDWTGMKSYLAAKAEVTWEEAMVCNAMGYPWRMIYGVEPGWHKDEFVHARSHPSTFAVVKDSDWYWRGNVGWWGVELDAEPCSYWHAQYDHLLADCQPDTMITVIDCHIGGT